MCKDFRSFWKTWKVKNYKNPISVSNIYGITDDVAIVEHFKSKCEEVSSTSVVADNICKVAYSAPISDYVFGVDLVDSVISTSLKRGKAPGLDSLTVEHFTYAHPSVVVHLTRLFNLILKHGYVPNAFGDGIVVPLIKDKNGDVCSSDNYRGITISPIVTKKFERCILHKFGDFFN